MNVEQHDNIMKVIDVADFDRNVIDNRFEADGNYVYVTFRELNNNLMHALGALHLKYDIRIYPINYNQLQVNFVEKTDAD